MQWTPWAQFDDLNFADDLAPLSYTQRQAQEKTSTVVGNSARLGLQIHRGKSKVVKNNAAVSTKSIAQEGLEEVTSFTYLGGIADEQGGGGGGGGLMSM